MATAIDDNAADGQSYKSMCQLIIVRCTSIENYNHSGYEHLTLRGENIFIGTKRVCIDFLDGLVQFQLLNK